MKRPRLDFGQQMASVPMRNARAVVTRDADGTAIVTLELRQPGWMKPLRRWVRSPPTARYRLDRIGTEVFDSIDGRGTFGELVDAFAARHRLGFFESRALLVQYMEALMRRGIIVIGVEKEGA